MNSGLEAIIGFLVPNLCAILIDKEGKVVGTREKPISETGLSTIAGVYPRLFQKTLSKEFEQFQKELGLTVGPIGFKKFEVPKFKTYIQDFPDFIIETLTNPEGHCEQDVQESEQSLKRWIEDGQYILYCFGCEYWVDGKGEVVAT